MLHLIYQYQEYWGDMASVFCALAWAVAIIFYQNAGLKMGSLATNVFKNSVGFVLVLITLLVMGEPLWPEIDTDQLTIVVISAFFGVTLADLFLVAALRRLGASLQAIVDCAYSPTIMVIAYFMFSEVLSSADLIGGALVIAAVWVGSLTKSPSSSTEKKQNPSSSPALVPGIGLGLLLGASTHALNGYSVLLVKELFTTHSILWVIAARFFFGQIFLISGALAMGKKQEVFAAFCWQQGHGHALCATFFGNYIALIFWMVGFKYTLAGKSAIYNQLSTVFIIILAALFLGEKLTGRRLIAVALGISGALIVAL